MSDVGDRTVYVLAERHDWEGEEVIDVFNDLAAAKASATKGEPDYSDTVWDECYSGAGVWYGTPYTGATWGWTIRRRTIRNGLGV